MSFSTKKCSTSSSRKLILFASFIVLVALSCAANASNTLYVGYFPGEGMKAYDGSWRSFGGGLPDTLNAEQIVRDTRGNLYLTTEFSGIFRCAAGESEWKDISSPLMKRRTQLKGVDEYRRISAFCIDDKNPDRLYCATKHTLYASADAGKSWQKMTVVGHKNSYYFTSLCVSDGVLYAGTSFDGIFRVGSSFTDIAKGTPAEYYAGTLHFHEGVSALRSAGSTLYSGFLFGRGACASADKASWQKVAFELKKPLSEAVYDIAPVKNGVLISTEESIYEVSGSSVKQSALDTEIRKACGGDIPSVLLVMPENSRPSLLVRRFTPETPIDRTSKAGQKRAIYVSWSKLEKDLAGVLDLAVRNGFNAIIIDVKDDFGVINAPIQSKTAQEIGAIRNTNITDIIKKCHEKGLYVIARNVTFKDKKLYSAYESKYAIWDSTTNQPWVGLPREKWCDPFSKFVRDYNIEVAKETAKLGFDEIQFDYIRYPTDGATVRCQFRYRENSDVYKSEIMGDFLQEAQESINVPISIDIYGYNAWYRFGNLIGQDEEFLSRFVDVICPMVYPSHFGGSFYKKDSVEQRPYTIVRDSGIRSLYFARNRSVSRLWIQDFKYQSPTWGTDYVLKQIQATYDSGCESYSLWNPAGDHSMADKALYGQGKNGKLAKNEKKEAQAQN